MNNDQITEVPWFELHFNEKEIQAVLETLKTGWLGIGPKVKEFEKRLADYVGTKHAIAVNSGTAALDVALKVLDVNPGDEVIVPGLPYIATANCVLYQNAIPVFSDIDMDHFGLDANYLEKIISNKTKVIIPINYGGHSIDWDKLYEITNKYELKVIEDGAASFGGLYKNKKLCSMGDIGITSFHIAKTFTTIEGGMIFTDNDLYAKKARMIRSHGEDPNLKYWHPMIGHNYRMTDINASIGLVQFSRIEKLLSSRAKAANYYSSKLIDKEGIKIPFEKYNNTHSWFIYPILVENRNKVKSILEEKGIGTNVSWPYPGYEQEHLKKYKKENLENVEYICSRILGLPMFYKLNTKQQDYVIENLINAVSN